MDVISLSLSPFLPYSRCTHSLIEILLANEYSTDMTSKEEAKQVLLVSLELISGNDDKVQ